MAARCEKCGHRMVPPRPICAKCFSNKLSWADVPTDGEVVSFSEVHVSNAAFQNMVPYVVAIVKHDEELKLAGIIKEVNREEVSIGTKVRLKVDSTPGEQWPHWPRYYYTKLSA